MQGASKGSTRGAILAAVIGVSLALPGLAAAERGRTTAFVSRSSVDRPSSRDDGGSSSSSTSSSSSSSRRSSSSSGGASAPRFERRSAPVRSAPSSPEPRSRVSPSSSASMPAFETGERPPRSPRVPSSVERRGYASDDDDDGEVFEEDAEELPGTRPPRRRRHRRVSRGVGADAPLYGASPSCGCPSSVCVAGRWVRGGRLSIGARAGAFYGAVLGDVGAGAGAVVAYRLVPTLSLEVRGDGYVGVEGWDGPQGFSLGWLSVGITWYFINSSIAQPYITGGIDVAFLRAPGAPEVETRGGAHLGLGVVLAVADFVDLLLEVRGVAWLRDDEIAEVGVVMTGGIDFYL